MIKTVIMGVRVLNSVMAAICNSSAVSKACREGDLQFIKILSLFVFSHFEQPSFLS